MRGERYRWVARLWRDLGESFGCAHLVLVGKVREDVAALCGARPSHGMRWDNPGRDSRKCRKCSDMLRPNSMVVEPDPAPETPQVKRDHRVLIVQAHGQLRVFHAQDENALQASALSLLREHYATDPEVMTLLNEGDGQQAWALLEERLGDSLKVVCLEGPCGIPGCARDCPLGKWRNRRVPVS